MWAVLPELDTENGTAYTPYLVQQTHGPHYRKRDRRGEREKKEERGESERVRKRGEREKRRKRERETFPPLLPGETEVVQKASKSPHNMKPYRLF